MELSEKQLEEIALTEWMHCEHFAERNFAFEFAKRLIAALPKPEPVAWANMREDGVTPCLLSISQHPEDRARWMNPVPLYTESQPEQGNYKAQRDALLEALEEALECGEDGDWQSARRVLVAAIDQPRDDSALRRLLAEAKAGVYEECAKLADTWEDAGDVIRSVATKRKEEEC